jgi:mono/diheme cytochrome c family protein
MKLWKVSLLVVMAAVMVGTGAYVVRITRQGFGTRSQPSALEVTVARTIRSWSIPRAERKKPNPWAQTVTAEIMAEARAHWAEHCATCHANDGSGNTEMGQNLYPKAPDMRRPGSQDLTDGELYYIIRSGIRLTGMPAWGDPGLEQDDESWHLVLFIRHLPQITPEELREMERLNPKTEAQRLADEEAERFLNEGVAPQSQEPVHH